MKHKDTFKFLLDNAGYSLMSSAMMFWLTSMIIDLYTSMFFSLMWFVITVVTTTNKDISDDEIKSLKERLDKLEGK